MRLSKEKLKSILIAGLFIVALSLTQWVMYDGLFASDIDESDIDVKSTQLSKYINPQSYMVSFGGISYTRIYDTDLQEQIWNEVRPVLVDTILSYETMIEIERETYIKAFNDRGILFRMPLDLSISNFVSVFTTLAPDLEISMVTPYEFILSRRDRQGIYVYDRLNDQYLLLKAVTPIHDIDALVDLVESKPYIEYRKLSNRFSLESTVDETHNQLNYELIPFQYGKIIPSIDVQNEIFFVNDEPVGGFQEISEIVFGNRMDFVKRLKDVNGSTIFMYGYGEKILTFSPNGRITYQKRYEPNTSTELNFVEAFAIAAGRLENFGHLLDHIYLSGYEYVNESHRFKFSYKIDDYQVESLDPLRAPIEVEVKGSQIVKISKDMKRIVERVENTNIDRLYSIDECIENNYLEVSVYYLQDNNIYDSALENMAYYFPIRSAISEIELRYTKVESESDRLVPAWYVVISDRTYLFNAYTGNMIKTFR